MGRLAKTMTAATAFGLALCAAAEADLWNRRDEPAARAEIAARYEPFVREVVKCLIRDRRVPARFGLDELVSAGHVALLQAIPLYDPARGWMFTTFAAKRIRGEVLRELRRLSRRDALFPTEGRSLEPSDRGAGADEMRRRVADRRIVERLWEELPPRDRQIIALRFYEGLSTPEIARAIGLGKSQTKDEIQRILARLRRLVEAWEAA